MSLNMTLIGELIAFIVFVLFCMKFVWPPLNNAIEARQKKIADGLAAGEKAEKSLEEAQAKVADELKDAKAQAAEIIAQAKKRADETIEDGKKRGEQEREKIVAAGHSEVEAERNRNNSCRKEWKRNKENVEKNKEIEASSKTSIGDLIKDEIEESSAKKDEEV